MNTVKILDWRPLPKNSLLGFAKIEFPSGMILGDITILTSAVVHGRHLHPSR